MKKLMAVGLMALVLGVGAPAIFADGPQETPGHDGTSGRESAPVTPELLPETPGSLILDVIVSLATTLVA